ncbi:MAG: DEAD/DEAH box helicase [Thermodesulfobacteriota bacterium]
MHLDILDNILVIKGIDSNLKPRHKSQLNDWGFTKDTRENDLRLNDNIETVLPKVLKYFTKSNINYTISDSCNNLIEEISKKTNRFRQLMERGKDFKEGKFDRDDFAKHLSFLSTNIPRKLKEHQIKAAYHLYLVGNGANFSVPGSGKTTVVLCAYERLKSKGDVNTLFVVGPTACFGPWKDEFKLVLGRNPSCCILAGGDKLQRKLEYFKSHNTYELYLTTFQTLLNDQDEVCSFFKERKVNVFLVIDEAHYIKQVNGNWANAVLKIANYSKYRCILTGTPIPRSYVDLYNLFDFLWPNSNLITSEDKAKLRILEEKKEYKTARKVLEPAVGPLFYRVRKSELNLSPQVFHEPIIIQMNTYERKVYDAIMQKIITYAKEDFLKNIELVLKLRRGRMIRLRQCLSYTKLLRTAITDYTEDIIEDDNDLRYVIRNYDNLEMPAKLHCLVKLVKEFQEKQEKVLIWANFINTIKLIETTFKDLGFYSKKIIGETPIEKTSLEEEETREKIRNEFVDEESGLNILLANPAACAESISLHKTCHNAIYYDLSYNCSQYLQSLDRIHRVGGSEENQSNYFFLQYENTIDPDILKNLKSKARKMYDVIEGDYNIYSLDMFEDSDELAAYERLFLEQ